jgi:hypothetical protein
MYKMARYDILIEISVQWLGSLLHVLEQMNYTLGSECCTVNVKLLLPDRDFRSKTRNVKGISECTVNVHWIIDTIPCGSEDRNRIKNRIYVPRGNTITGRNIYEWKQHLLALCLSILSMLVCPWKFKACSFSLPMSLTLVVFCSSIPLSTSKTVVQCSSCNFQVLEDYPIEHHLRHFS